MKWFFLFLPVAFSPSLSLLWMDRDISSFSATTSSLEGDKYAYAEEFSEQPIVTISSARLREISEDEFVFRHNPFHPERRAFSEETVTARQPVNDPLSNTELVASIAAPEIASIILRDRASGDYISLRTGAQFGGWTVDEIDETQARFVQGQRVQVLYLEGTEENENVAR